jgi:hypothetical protein
VVKPTKAELKEKKPLTLKEQGRLEVLKSVKFAQDLDSE